MGEGSSLHGRQSTGTPRTGLDRRPAAWGQRVVMLIGVAVLGSAALALAPLVIREAPASGVVDDSAAVLPGQGQQATQALRGLGYRCADAATTRELVTRVCANADGPESGRVQLVVAADTGVIELARTDIDARDARRVHGEVAATLAQTVGMEPNDQEAVRKAATDGTGAALTLPWGSFTPTPQSDDYDSEFRAAEWFRTAPAASTVTFAASVDSLAATATSLGYECVTPQLDTVRSCNRNADGYGYDLWLQGTDTYVTTVELSVTASFRTHTRRRWFDEMGKVFRDVDTDQARRVVTWLERSADAPGADTYIDGLPFTFLSRREGGTKETFGGVLTECGRVVDDISGCAP